MLHDQLRCLHPQQLGFVLWSSIAQITVVGSLAFAPGGYGQLDM